MLEVGSELTLSDPGRRCVLQRFIGEGSQGTVYVADIDSGRETVALKWYFPRMATAAQRQIIEDLIDRGSPNSCFLWPTEIVEIDSEPGFGYLMALRPDSYAGLAELLTGKVDVAFSVVCTLGLELAGSFLALHSEGLCYRDISFGNVFFDPATGRPLICDNDNVGVDGISPSFVLGTRRFMAPEIVRREAGPSIATDLYSLSVLLFYLLIVGHPLVGRRELDFPTWDDRAESLLFGQDPVFVFDPTDARNQPLDDLHGSVLTNWGIYPEHIRRLFTTAFTTGLTDARNGRVRESVWRASMARLRDSIMRCSNCDKENFWEPGVPRSCWFCDHLLGDPVRLEIDGRPLVLSAGTVVYPHHLTRGYDFSVPIGVVAAHPAHPDRWGLRNDSQIPWHVVLPGGDQVVAEPGRSVGLLPGTTIRIGSVTAQIVH